MKKTPIAIFASGRGSHFKTLVDGKLDADITCLVCDRKEAPVMDIAKKAGVPVVLVPGPSDRTDSSRRKHEEQIEKKLEEFNPRFLVLAGYMRVFTPAFLKSYRDEKGYNRVVNIHPSLLPAFPGLHSYKKAFEHGCKVSGFTVHLVEDGVDAGPICEQKTFSIEDCSSAEEVEALGIQLEHQWYGRTLNWVLKEKFKLEKRAGRVCVRPS